MAFDGRAQLAYQLVDLDTNFSTDNPLTAKKLELWLAQLPLLNTKKLISQLLLYVQDINKVKVSDKQRFKILELLRPIIAHLYDVLTKQCRGKNLTLTRESEETQWLANVLLSEIAMGYQRLLFNIADKKPNIFNRKYYCLLAERAIYYLGERICLAYMSCTDVPKHVWHNLNSSYLFAQNLRLNTIKLKDDFAFDGIKKGSIDMLYKRILLLSMITPYSLRSAELEQIYFGFLPWLDSLKLLNTFSSSESSYFIDLSKDDGPEFDACSEAENNTNILVIDNSSLVSKATEWLDTGKLPSSVDSKGMTKKLLGDVIDKLNGSIQRGAERISSTGEQVDVIIGFRNIDLFLEHTNLLTQTENLSSIFDVTEEDKTGDFDIDTEWGQREELGNWAGFHSPPSQGKIEHYNEEPKSKGPEVRHHIFTIENESEKGVCLSCNSLNGVGLFIGELLFIRGSEQKTWTLGIIRWMKVGNKKLNIGLYLISTKVDRVQLSRNSSAENIIMTYLWLAEGEQGDTLLLPSAEFKTGDALDLDHHGDALNTILGDIVWHSEGFSQFCFKVIPVIIQSVKI